MTNFLNRLAGRALGIIPLAQPIIPARFDPITERSVWPEGSAADRVRSSTESDSSAPAQTAFRAYEIEPSSRVAAGPQKHSPPYTQAEDEPHTRPPSILHPMAAAEMRSSQSRLSGAENSVPLPYTGQKQQHQHPTQVDAEPMPPRQAMAHPEIFRAEALEDRRMRDQRGVFADYVRSAVSDPAPNRPQHPVPYPLPKQSPPSAAPVIRVTIGRIDVRAELASPPTPAARRTRPSILSLDQFLQQRSGVGQ